MIYQVKLTTIDGDPGERVSGLPEVDQEFSAYKVSYRSRTRNQWNAQVLISYSFESEKKIDGLQTIVRESNDKDVGGHVG